MNDSNEIPDFLNPEIPSPSRVYDYLLGGHHNFPSDRAIAEQALAVDPNIRLAAHVNRAFLRRVVNYMCEQGIDQFLDLGSGIPTAGNVHDVAGKINPKAKVVYVDLDPVAVKHSKSILVDVPGVTAIQADVRQSEDILNHPETQQILDFNRPIGLLMLTVLHYILDDEEAYGIVNAFSGHLASGSFLAISHGSTEAFEGLEFLTEQFKADTRTKDKIAGFFKDFKLVEPGLVYAPLWHPEGEEDIFLNEPEKGYNMAGVGRKP